ncbi:MAG TPA: sugar phosphate isomerase/epimerase [Armatimonadota bacterium]
MPNTISCNLASYGPYRQNAFKHLASIGLTNVEWEIPAPEEADAFAQELASHGLKATSLMAPSDLSSDAGLDSMRQSVATASKLGVPMLFLSCKAGETPRAEALGRLAKMADIAAEKGITLAVETHPDLAHNGTVAAQTLAEVGRPNLGINYDTGNVYYYNQNINGIEELRKILDRVVSVHLKDTNGGFETWYFPTLGQGIVDYPQVFKLLNDRGFTGPFTMELEGIQGENFTEAQQQQRVADSLNYLKSIGVA